MYFLYILHSQTIDRYYIGYTANIDDRISKHNKPHKGFTGRVNDWMLMYTESYERKSDAIKREKEIKKWKSRQKIERLIK